MFLRYFLLYDKYVFVKKYVLDALLLSMSKKGNKGDFSKKQYYNFKAQCFSKIKIKKIIFFV